MLINNERYCTIVIKVASLECQVLGVFSGYI